jgi:hypothetical protein
MPAQLSEAQAERLIKLYDAAEKEIISEYNRALLKGNSTKNLETLKKNISIIRRDLLAGGRTWCEQAIPSLYGEAAGAVDVSLGISGFGFSGVNQRAMQILADNAFQRLQEIDTVIGRRAEDVYRNLAMESVRADISGQSTWKQVAKNYREKLAAQGVTGFVDAAGRSWNIKTYTEMVAQTTAREAMIQGTANRLLEHGHDLARITGGSSKLTCQNCLNWLGKTVSLTGATKGYPTLADARAGGLFHPRCTHNIAAEMGQASNAPSAPQAPKRTPQTDPMQPVQIQTKTGTKGEPIPQRAENAGGNPKIKDAAPGDFIKNRDELPKGLRAFLTPYTAEEYEAAGVKLKLYEGGKGGYGLKGDELISVFSKPGKHLGYQLVEDAKANGAKRLDCLGDDLVSTYKRNGFKVIKTDKWDDKYAPKDWDYVKHGRPNLYYMELRD